MTAQRVHLSSRIASLAGASLCVIALRGAAAQTVTGVVTDSITHQRVRGAVVMGIDAGGSARARTLSDAAGNYRLVLAAGVLQLRVLRIGFRPRTIPISPGARGLVTLDISLARLPTMLEAVHATAAARCPRRSNTAAALALWEQARAGLLATVVARDIDPPKVERLHYDRIMRGSGERIASQAVSLDVADAAAQPFAAARNGADFARFGFRAADGETFFGPDADVLLDDGFAKVYCFSLASRASAHPHAAGLEFFAPRHIDGRTDIEGTLWIDTLSRRLSDIEFRYVGFNHAIESRHPGGTVSFREMPNGSVLIDRWYLRLVGARNDTTFGPGGPTQTTEPSVHTELVVHEIGGELAHATWTDGSQWQAPLGTIRGVLTRDGRPVPTGVHVALGNTSYATVTDSLGRFAIRDLLPGPYRMYVSDPDLAAFGFVEDSSVTFVAARDSVASGTFAVETLDDYFASSCGLPVESARHANAVLGRVSTARGLPVADVRLEFSTTPPVPATRYFPSGSYKMEYFTGTNGEFVFCHPPFDGTVAVHALYRGVPLDTVTRSTTRDVRLILIDIPVDTAASRPLIHSGAVSRRILP